MNYRGGRREEGGGRGRIVERGWRETGRTRRGRRERKDSGKGMERDREDQECSQDPGLSL